MSAINHQWNGSILTVISDSGASSADLKGPRGETGPRGPQGPAGVIYDENGDLAIDLSPYATADYVEDLINNYTPDLSNYATKPEVLEAIVNNPQDLSSYATRDEMKTEIAKAQLEGAGVDTSVFLTKDDIEDVNVKIDGQTIIKDTNGVLKTAIGGYAQEGAMFFKADSLYYVPKHWTSGGTTPTTGPLVNTGTSFTDGTYHIKVTFDNGYVEERNIDLVGNIYGEYIWDEYANGGQPEYISQFEGTSSGNVYIQTSDIVCVITAIEITRGARVPLDANYIPVDGTSIYVNSEGNLACSISIGDDNSINLDNFYTKSEIDALLANLSISGESYPSGEEVNY